MLIQKADKRIRQYLHFLNKQRYTRIIEPQFEVYETTTVHRKPPESATWSKITLPHAYGKEWTSYWYRTKFTLPQEAAGRQVFLRAVPNADSLVFMNGKPIGALNPFHENIRLTESGKPGTEYQIHFESYAGHKFPGEHPFQGDSVILTLGAHIDDYPNLFRDAAIMVKNEAAYALYYDAHTLFDLASHLDDNSLRRNRIMQELYRGLMKIRFTAEGKEFDDQVDEALAIVKPLLTAENSATSPEVMLVGHAHIDHAWLWPLWETERKAARTFANMARFSEEYDEFVFVQSQPIQLDIIKREYPEIFTSVKAAFERGQWEPNGGMWVEADCNLTGGESLIRQFIVGKQATREMLGYEGDTLWLPDVFGYAAALPQILTGCEIDYFVTSKINWNDTTRFPYDTFIWRGIDGSATKTHYITSRMNGYNGKVRVADLFDAWNQVQHKEVQSGVVKPIGEGDGGGGTMRADLEYARRLGNLEGSPRARWSKVSDALEQIFADTSSLPEWQGELYLELHRGTYTTQARTKRYNRKLEFALRETEALFTLGSAIAGSSFPKYPRAELLACWKKVLTNQFHDIIPGSSINAVYRDAEAWYAEVEVATNKLIEQAGSALARTLWPTQTAGKDGGNAIAVFNTLSWNRMSHAVISGKAAAAQTGAAQMTPLSAGISGPLPVQRTQNLLGEPEVHTFLPVDATGAALFRLEGAQSAPASAFKFDGTHLTTPFYRAELDPARRIAHLVDVATGREYVKTGAALNSFVSAEDMPILWDAWDIDADWTASMVDEQRIESTEVVSDGPLFIQIRSRYRIGRASTLVQDIFFYAQDRRVDFVTMVDWHENHRLLKVGFPVNITSGQVRCEVQYGHVVRPNNDNLPQDRARFEFCAHKWVSMEENGCGAALLNDCKYGYDVDGNNMRLTLLRSPKAPDPEADMGVHHFTYAFLPYEGHFAAEEVVHSAYDLNRPLTVVHVGADNAPAPAQSKSAAGAASFLTVDDPNIIIEAIKLAEEGNEVVVRMYESGGGARRARLASPLAIGSATITNMLERKPEAIAHDAHGVRLEFRPFEIKTVKLGLA